LSCLLVVTPLTPHLFCAAKHLSVSAMLLTNLRAGGDHIAGRPRFVLKEKPRSRHPHPYFAGMPTRRRTNKDTAGASSWYAPRARSWGRLRLPTPKRPRRPQRSSSIWTKSGGIGSWCRSWREPGGVLPDGHFPRG
jgi:hypothetical protein